MEIETLWKSQHAAECKVGNQMRSMQYTYPSWHDSISLIENELQHLLMNITQQQQ